MTQWIDRDPARLDRAWRLVQAERNAGRLTGERLEQAEWLLLMKGVAQPSDDTVRPRRYVVDAALQPSRATGA